MLTQRGRLAKLGGMGRPLRIERAGGWYHITGRGNERRAIFRDVKDRLHFVELIGRMVERFRVLLHAYQLMDNHYHLIIELKEKNLSRAGQWLNLSYANWFNRRHSRSGHLFQGRFKSVIVDPVEWGLRLSRYVHLNPVRIGALGLNKVQQRRIRAGATGAPDRQVVKRRIELLRRNEWGSYRAYAGMGKRPEWLTCDVILGLLGGSKEQRQKNYMRYVESAIREGLPESPWEQLTEKVALGGKRFLEQLREHVLGNAREQRGAARLARARPTLQEVIATVEEIKGQKWEEFREKHGDSGRDLVLYAGQRVCGMKLQELAKAIGLRDYGTVSSAIRRLERSLRHRPIEKKQWERISKKYKNQM